MRHLVRRSVHRSGCYSHLKSVIENTLQLTYVLLRIKFSLYASNASRTSSTNPIHQPNPILCAENRNMGICHSLEPLFRTYTLEINTSILLSQMLSYLSRCDEYHKPITLLFLSDPASLYPCRCVIFWSMRDIVRV